MSGYGERRAPRSRSAMPRRLRPGPRGKSLLGKTRQDPMSAEQTAECAVATSRQPRSGLHSPTLGLVAGIVCNGPHQDDVSCLRHLPTPRLEADTVPNAGRLRTIYGFDHRADNPRVSASQDGRLSTQDADRLVLPSGAENLRPVEQTVADRLPLLVEHDGSG